MTGFLPIGDRAWEQFSRLAGGNAIMTPFIYVVRTPSSHEDSVRQFEPGKRVRFVFAGQLIPRKGIDLLLRALSGVPSRDYLLDVVGTGGLADSLKEYVEERAMPVRFHGAIQNRMIPTSLATADCLVLPSRYDGWGAVVNEALAVGTRALVSDMVGAQQLVRDQTRGAIFQADDIPSLRGALTGAIERGRLEPKSREDVAVWARSAISPEILAPYFADFTGGGQPQAPWLSVR